MIISRGIHEFIPDLVYASRLLHSSTNEPDETRDTTSSSSNNNNGNSDGHSSGENGGSVYIRNREPGDTEQEHEQALLETTRMNLALLMDTLQTNAQHPVLRELSQWFAQREQGYSLDTRRLETLARAGAAEHSAASQAADGVAALVNNAEDTRMHAEGLWQRMKGTLAQMRKERERNKGREREYEKSADGMRRRKGKQRKKQRKRRKKRRKNGEIEGRNGEIVQEDGENGTTKDGEKHSNAETGNADGTDYEDEEEDEEYDEDDEEYSSSVLSNAEHTHAQYFSDSELGIETDDAHGSPAHTRAKDASFLSYTTGSAQNIEQKRTGYSFTNSNLSNTHSSTSTEAATGESQRLRLLLKDAHAAMTSLRGKLAAQDRAHDREKAQMEEELAALRRQVDEQKAHQEALEQAIEAERKAAQEQQKMHERALHAREEALQQMQTRAEQQQQQAKAQLAAYQQQLRGEKERENMREKRRESAKEDAEGPPHPPPLTRALSFAVFQTRQQSHAHTDGHTGTLSPEAIHSSRALQTPAQPSSAVSAVSALATPDNTHAHTRSRKELVPRKGLSALPQSAASSSSVQSQAQLPSAQKKEPAWKLAARARMRKRKKIQKETAEENGEEADGNTPFFFFASQKPSETDDEQNKEKKEDTDSAGEKEKAPLKTLLELIAEDPHPAMSVDTQSGSNLTLSFAEVWKKRRAELDEWKKKLEEKRRIYGSLPKPSPSASGVAEGAACEEKKKKQKRKEQPRTPAAKRTLAKVPRSRSQLRLSQDVPHSPLSPQSAAKNSHTDGRYTSGYPPTPSSSYSGKHHTQRTHEQMPLSPSAVPSAAVRVSGEQSAQRQGRRNRREKERERQGGSVDTRISTEDELSGDGISSEMFDTSYTHAESESSFSHTHSYSSAHSAVTFSHAHKHHTHHHQRHTHPLSSASSSSSSAESSDSSADSALSASEGTFAQAAQLAHVMEYTGDRLSQLALVGQIPAQNVLPLTSSSSSSSSSSSFSSADSQQSHTNTNTENVSVFPHPLTAISSPQKGSFSQITRRHPPAPLQLPSLSSAEHPVLSAVTITPSNEEDRLNRTGVNALQNLVSPTPKNSSSATGHLFVRPPIQTSSQRLFSFCLRVFSYIVY